MEKYQKLTVIKIVGKNKHSQKLVKCLCDCGNICIKTLMCLKRGTTKSCGCFGKQNPSNFQHGFSYTKFYRVFRGIKNRTENKKVKSYKDYGGRGILCLWVNFSDFHQDMYLSYLKHLEKHGSDTTIERINVNGNYCKNNCKWATRLEQSSNRRDLL